MIIKACIFISKDQTKYQVCFLYIPSIAFISKYKKFHEKKITYSQYPIDARSTLVRNLVFV